ncbi:hypothetical protein Cgig2_022898 [Carnegiea gigantea]|uniref:GATA-type domain-containing protein n=1 Tax=Carnegiea gigantea TaxID=171969 RepID=A0A9Q1KP76_9CARY|nr:hypothetical protein Cgig2_022898 [Carnegiea gigantea]
MEDLEIFNPNYDFPSSILDYDFHDDFLPIPPFFPHDQESQESFSCRRHSNLRLDEYQNNASDHTTLESQIQLVTSKTGLIDSTYKRQRKRSQCPRGRNSSWAKLDLWKHIDYEPPPHNAVRAHKPRRCTHCQIEKTPQWREGPMGKKTLCNACGLRHKSGRLLPEYRPAASPTFDDAKHSNFHKKVEKMRGNAKRSEEDTMLA